MSKQKVKPEKPCIKCHGTGRTKKEGNICTACKGRGKTGGVVEKPKTPWRKHALKISRLPAWCHHCNSVKDECICFG